MLDTDTCSYIMKRSNPPVLKRLQAVPVTDVCMSVVTKAELLYGVEVSPRRAQDAAALAAFLPYVEVLELPDEDAALHYAEIRADLKKRGAMIGANDLFIAAHARALGLTLVTNNTAEFERVKGLAIENWTLPVSRSRSTRTNRSALNHAWTGALMHVLIVILQMGLIITALVVAVGAAFYALVWVSLVAASVLPDHWEATSPPKMGRPEQAVRTRKRTLGLA